MSAKASVRSALIRTAVALRADELSLALSRYLFRWRQSPRMQVIEMHETPERDEPLLRQQLQWASRHFTLVDLPTFAKMWEQFRADPKAFLKLAKPPLLFTFDDGRLNNYTVAAPLLETFGTRGLFFVVPKFVQSDPQESKQFYYSRIDIRESPPSIPDEDTRSMTPKQIGELSQRGHAIGSHTYSHVNLATLPETELHHEIAESAAQIASWTGKLTDAFAWTFSWDSITTQAWKLIQQHHRYCFAPCPGTINCKSDSRALIWRTEVEVAYPQSEYRFMYAGLANPLWRSRREQLKAALGVASSK